MTIEEFKQQLEATRVALAKDGWKITISFNPEDAIDEEENEHFSSIWFGGLMASFEKGNKLIEISAYGDVDVDIFRKDNNDIVADCTDKNNTGLVGKFLREYFKNDQELGTEKDGYYANFNNNNWYEVELFEKVGDTWYADGQMDEVCDEDDISFMLTEGYIRDIIKDFGIEKED